MEETQYQGQVLSFIDLINKHSIEIPIIQRDYAQGRQDKQKIRHLFLKALHESLINEQNLMLDFVYGSVVADNTFQPLDAIGRESCRERLSMGVVGVVQTGIWIVTR